MAKRFWEYFVKNKPVEESDHDGDDGGSSGSGRIKPKDGEGFASYLVEETDQMRYERRGLEQQVERRLGRVEERKKPQRKTENTLTNGQEHMMKQHPLLDSQRFDGIDSSLNPAPFGNEEAKIAFENEKREQDQEKQLRMGLNNAPKMGNRYLPELRR